MSWLVWVPGLRGPAPQLWQLWNEWQTDGAGVRRSVLQADEVPIGLSRLTLDELSIVFPFRVKAGPETR